MIQTPLNQVMRCSILSNVHGDIVILHGQAFMSEISWVEFNKIENAFMIVYEDGEMQNLGIPIEPQMAENIAQGTIVQFVLMVDDKMTTVTKTSVVIQDY